MGEALLAIILVTLIVLAIRRAKPVVLENSVTIERPGQYHIILAPQLNRAQTFIEQIAKSFILLHPPHADLPTQYYEVRDPLVFAEGESAYLLAATLRDGMIYFQAINPEPFIYDKDSHYRTLRAYAEMVLKRYSHSAPADLQWADKLRHTIDTTAGLMKIAVTELQE